MRILLAIIIFATLAHSSETDSLIAKLSAKKCFYSALKIKRISPTDTADMKGEIAIGNGKFYASVGEERYLQNDTSGLWGWISGGDASRVGNMIDFANLGRTIKSAEANFTFNTLRTDKGWLVQGTASTDDNPIRAFQVTFSKKLLPQIFIIWDNRGTKIEFSFDKPSFKCPPENLFTFPKGVKKIGGVKPH